MTRVSALLLAAGESRRMRGLNKLYLDFDGEPLLRRSVRTLLAFPFEEVVVVLGPERERAAELLRDLRVRTTFNPDYAEGQMTSVHAGLAALEWACEGVMICLVDQPRLTAGDLGEIVRVFSRRGGHSIVVPTFEGRRGNPIIIAAAQRDSILGARRNLGCKHLIERHPEEVLAVEMSNDHVVADIDTPEAYHALVARLGRERSAAPPRPGHECRQRSI